MIETNNNRISKHNHKQIIPTYNTNTILYDKKKKMLICLKKIIISYGLYVKGLFVVIANRKKKKKNYRTDFQQKENCLKLS